MKIWTNGTCKPNPGTGDWGWHRDDGQCCFGWEPHTTNHRMGLMAILEALSVLDEGASVTVFSDNKYCVDGLTVWREGWKRKDWMKGGSPLMHRDLLLRLEVQLCRVNAEFVRILKSDSNNKKADALACRGIKACADSPLTPADLPPYAAYCGVHANTPALAAVRARVERYRRECEARWVLRLPFAERRPYLASTVVHRGQAGRQYLQDDVVRQHRLTRQMERP